MRFKVILLSRVERFGPMHDGLLLAYDEIRETSHFRDELSKIERLINLAMMIAWFANDLDIIVYFMCVCMCPMYVHIYTSL